MFLFWNWFFLHLLHCLKNLNTEHVFLAESELEVLSEIKGQIKRFPYSMSLVILRIKDLTKMDTILYKAKWNEFTVKAFSLWTSLFNNIYNIKQLFAVSCFHSHFSLAKVVQRNEFKMANKMQCLKTSYLKIFPSPSGESLKRTSPYNG